MEATKIQFVFIRLLLVLIACQYCNAFFDDNCDGFNRFLKPKCFMSNCPLRDNYCDIISSLFHSHIAGQDDAVQQILSALCSHDWTEPLIFHFAGDNGTGKTSIAKLIAQGKYAKMDSTFGFPVGVLYIRGNSYLYDETGIIRKTNKAQYFQQIEVFKKQLRADIVAQLSKCPESLIIFDEYTIPNRRILAVLEEFLDGNPIRVDENTFVSARQATFIFLSDFGVENFSANHTDDELLEIIEQDVSAAWGDKLLKLRHLQKNIIPFRPLPIPSPEEIEKLDITKTTVPDSVITQIKQLLRKIDNVDHPALELWTRKNKNSLLGWHCDNSCTQNIGKLVYHRLLSFKMYRYRNYRGIEQIFGDLVLNKLVMELKKLHPDRRVYVTFRPNINTKKVEFVFEDHQ